MVRRPQRAGLTFGGANPPATIGEERFIITYCIIKYLQGVSVRETDWAAANRRESATGSPLGEPEGTASW